MVAHAAGWRRLVVVLRCARVFCATGAGEIFVSLSGPDAVSPSSDTIPFWRASWKSHVHYTLRTGETLGPVWSGQQRCVNGVSLLEGAAWYVRLGAFGAWWENTEGAAVTGHRRLVTSPLLLFLFFLSMFLLLPQHFLGFKLLLSVWLLY
jgi:hypothetical protein